MNVLLMIEIIRLFHPVFSYQQVEKERNHEEILSGICFNEDVLI